MGQVKSKLPSNPERAVKYLQKQNSGRLDDIAAVCRSLEKEEKHLDRATFQKYFKYDEKTTDHLFEVFDNNGDGVLDRDEFVRGITMCSQGDLNEKMKFCFELSDASGDGYLQREELEEVLAATTADSFAVITAVSQQLSEAVDGAACVKLHPYEKLVSKTEFKNEIHRMVEEAYGHDTNTDGRLSYSEFFNWISKTPEVNNFLYSLFQVHEQSKKSNMAKNAELLWDLSDEEDEVYDSPSKPKIRGKGARISPEPLEINEVQLPGEVNVTPKNDTTKARKVKRMSTTRRLNASRRTRTTVVMKQERAVAVQISTRDRALRAWVRWTHITCFVSFLGILTMILEREMLHYVYFEKENTFSTILTFVLSANCLVLSICVVAMWKKYVDVLKDHGDLSSVSTICNTGWVMRRVALEILVSCIHVPPYVGGLLAHDVSLRYWVTSLLSWGMLLRLYLLPTLVQQEFFKTYMSSKLEFLAKLAGVSLDTRFSIRAYLRIHPYRLIVMTATIWASVTTFLLEEAENGLECTGSGASTTATTAANITNSTGVNQGDPNSAGSMFDIRGDLHLYDGACHLQMVPFLGWLYYATNMLLVVNPLRIPLSFAGDVVNIISGVFSTVIFAILVGAIATTISPTTTEMRVIRMISQSKTNQELQVEAVKYIQNFWRLAVRLKKKATKKMSTEDMQRYQRTTSVKERIAISERALHSSGCFGQRSAKQIRFEIELALMKWRIAKRKVASLPMLANISNDASTVLNELTVLKEEVSATVNKVAAVESELVNALKQLTNKADQVLLKL